MLFEDSDLDRLVKQGGALKVAADGSLQMHNSAQGQIVMPGAFNPVHEGHWKLAQAAQDVLGREAAFELSLTNVDKADLPPDEVRRRILQFCTRATIWITRAPDIRAKGPAIPSILICCRGRHRGSHSPGPLLSTG